MKITACLIVKNEEGNLRECLDSLKSFVDEIIVVDTGSTDTTVKIAGEYTNNVFFYQWDGDFASARNYALSKVTGDWIISIDADEIITNPEIIRTTLENLSTKVGGLLIELLNVSTRIDGSVDRFTIHLLRIFRNNRSFHWESIIHEQIVESIIHSGYSVSQSPIVFFHKGYDLSPEKMKEKQNRNLSLLTKALEKESDNGYLWFQRAKTFRALEDLNNAEKDIIQSLELLPKKHSVTPQALNEAAIIFFHKKNLEKALYYANESLKVVPNQSFALFISAETLSSMGIYETAKECYSAIKGLKTDAMGLIAGEYNIQEQHLDFRIGKCNVGLGKWEEAEQSFRHGLSVEQNDTGCLVGLANCFLRKNNSKEALELLRIAVRVDPNNTEIQRIIQKVIEETTTNKGIGVNNTKQSVEKLITLSMIVKNEEARLEDCLRSVEGIVDEIVIVDTGSTDNTITIAESYGAKIFHFPWNGDFSSARNEALKFCTGKWILYLDADERIHSEAKMFLRNMVSEMPDEVGALLCTIRSPHRQGEEKSELHTGAYPRLFRNYGYPLIKFQGRVHEQISPSIVALQKSIVASEIVIDHIGYDLDKQEMEKKLKRNYELLLQHVREEPQNAYAWFQLGQTLARMNVNREAEEALKLSLQIGDLAPHIQASAMAVLAQICGNNKRFEDALRWANESLQTVPEQIFAVHLKAYALLYLGRYSESEKAFLEVISRRENSSLINQKTGFEVGIEDKVIYDGLNAARLGMQQIRL